MAAILGSGYSGLSRIHPCINICLRVKKEHHGKQTPKDHSFFLGMLYPGSLGCWLRTGSYLYNRPPSLNYPLVSYVEGLVPAVTAPKWLPVVVTSDMMSDAEAPDVSTKENDWMWRRKE